MSSISPRLYRRGARWIFGPVVPGVKDVQLQGREALSRLPHHWRIQVLHSSPSASCSQGGIIIAFMYHRTPRLQVYGVGVVRSEPIVQTVGPDALECLLVSVCYPFRHYQSPCHLNTLTPSPRCRA